MARMLLHQVLDRPGNQLFLQAMEQEPVRAAMLEAFENASIPPGTPEPAYFLFSKQQLENVERLVNETALRLIAGVLREQSTPITLEKEELVRELVEGANRPGIINDANPTKIIAPSVYTPSCDSWRLIWTRQAIAANTDKR